jgi:sugar/nucleoside kinase (ribokinase family)
MTARLVSVGNVVLDIIATVPALPERGGDVLATGAGTAPGGSFNTMLAATRQGLPTAYAGAHGTGPFGDRIRAALRENGIEVLLEPSPDRDSGYDVALIDAGGERTFVTVFGAEGALTAGAVAGIRLGDADLVHVSGYGMLAETNARALAPWVAALPAAHLVLVDPGPLVADIPAEVLATLLARADWLSCNEREARLLSGEDDPAAAALALLRRARNVIVRTGPQGCLLAREGRVEPVPGFAVTAVDTNGAGDAHAGAFLAALAAGIPPLEAARRANACAALAVTRSGPATAPTLDEALALLG